MNKDLIQSIKVIVLSLLIGLGVSFVSAWTEPTGTPPENNVGGPINIGASFQSKTGGLSVGADGLWTEGGFVAEGKTNLRDKAYIGGDPNAECTGTSCNGGTGSRPSFFAKLSESLGLSKEAIAQSQPSYNWADAATLTVKGNISSSDLNGSGERSVCADPAGKLTICGGANCGPANNGSFTSEPTTSLCSSEDTASEVNGDGSQTPSWNWTCTPNSGGGAVANCIANMKIVPHIVAQEMNSTDCEQGLVNLSASADGGYGNLSYSWVISQISSPSYCQAFGDVSSNQKTLVQSLPRPHLVSSGTCNYSATLTVRDSATSQHVGITSQVIQITKPGMGCVN